MFRKQNKPDVKRTDARLLLPLGFDPLADRLRQEAIESWPDFSERLHQRILRAVGERREKGGQSPTKLRSVPAGTARRVLRTNRDCPPFSRRRLRGLAALLAAACVLCAAVVGWRIYDGRTAAIPATHAGQDANDAALQIAFQWSAEDLLAGDELADQAAAGLDNLLSSAGLSPQSGPLATDARLAADTLLRRLPVDVELAESP